MDAHRFDELTQRLAKTRSRRQVLRGLAGGGAAGLLALFGTDAAAKPKPGKPGKGCTPATCQPGQCGPVSDGCRGTLDCGTCCTPATCQPGQCGPVSDDCGGTMECNDCCFPALCGPGQCGLLDDGCGGTLDCGACCTPATTCMPGQCATVPDGCGGTFDCGTCSGVGESCVKGRCVVVCTPTTCQPGDCGTLDNGCGATMECGLCGGGETCLVGRCVCDGDGAICAYRECGTVVTPCGTFECGICPGVGAICVSGECCTPLTACPDGKNCGDIPDGCGGKINCGTCTWPELCGASLARTPNVCGWDPSTGCFVAGTSIAMADGTSKPIERVATGDDVLGRGGQATRVLGVLRPVLGDRPLYAINGGPAFVTASHPFLTEDGWKAIDPDAARAEVPGLTIGRLAVGDVLVGAGAGTAERPVPLRSLEGRQADPATQLYNLDVGGADTYVAAGLIVHNKVAL